MALSILCIIYLTYGIVLRLPFAFHNDLGVLTYIHGSGYFEDWPEGRQLLGIGRILNAVLSNYQFTFIKTLSDFTVFRAISIGIIAVMTIMFWIWLAKYALDTWVAAAVSVSLFLLPSCQLFVVWNTQLVPSVFPMLLVLAAALIMHADPLCQIAALRQGISVRMVSFSALAVIVLTLVNFIYPPTTAMFLIPTLACVLFLPKDQWPGSRLLVLRDVAVYSSSCLLFIVLQKKIVGPYISSILMKGEGGHGEPNYKLQIGDNLLDNFEQLFGVGGPIAFHLWDITFAWWSSAIVFAVLLAGVVAALVVQRRTPRSKRASYGTWFQYGAAIAGLLIVGNTPNLLSPQPAIYFRTLFVLSAMVGLLVFSALLSATSIIRQSDRQFIQRFLFFSVAILVAVSAQWTVSGATINTYSEMEVLRSWYQPGYFEKQVAVAVKFRGVSRDVRNSGRPALHVKPQSNLLGVYLPMEFGFWYKKEDVFQFLAREYFGTSVDKPFSMGLFLSDMRLVYQGRPNPWPIYWGGGPE